MLRKFKKLYLKNIRPSQSKYKNVPHKLAILFTLEISANGDQMRIFTIVQSVKCHLLPINHLA